MGVVLFILVVLVCLLLMGVVLVQNSKGGGLSADFSSSNQYMGVRKTSDFLEKATWGLAIGLFVLCLATTAVSVNSGDVVIQDSQMSEVAGDFINNPNIGAPPVTQEPVTPAPVEGAPE